MNLTELAAMILAVGGLTPLLTAVVQQPWWSDRARTVVGIVVSVVVGTVAYVTQFGLDFSSPSRVVVVIVGIIVAAAAAYKTIWKTLGIGALEAKTALPPPEARRARSE